LHPKKDNILKLINLLNLSGFEVAGIDNKDFDEIGEIDTFDGSIVDFDEGDDNKIIVSKQFRIANKLTKSDVLIDSMPKMIEDNENLKGVFAIVSQNVYDYPFKRVKIN